MFHWPTFDHENLHFSQNTQNATVKLKIAFFLEKYFHDLSGNFVEKHGECNE